jgi:hypothetical protein
MLRQLSGKRIAVIRVGHVERGKYGNAVAALAANEPAVSLEIV